MMIREGTTATKLTTTFLSNKNSEINQLALLPPTYSTQAEPTPLLALLFSGKVPVGSN
jgi:hypothetical protein